MVIDIECCGVNLVFKSTPSFLIMQQEEGLLEVEEFGQASYLDNDHKDTVVERSPKGRFVRFNDEIGYSQFKTVYRAYDADTGREVCWNSIKVSRLSEPDRKSVLRDIAVMKSLAHKNIMGCVDSWIDREKREIVFVTEIFSGGSLSNYLHKIKRPKLKVIKNWCLQLLEGLEYLHAHRPPVIHRNVKCENIFINTNTNEIKLGELGTLATSLDSSRSLYGSMDCPAPELLDGPLSPAADIYSFGMVLLEIVTLRPPYSECVNKAQIYKRIQNQIKPQSLEQINNQDLKNIISSCIAPVRQRPTVSELLQMEFWKANQEIDKHQVQVVSQEKFPVGNDDESPTGRNSINGKKFTKQNMVMQTQPDEEKFTIKINGVIEKKEREGEVILLFHLDSKRNYELSIPKDKEKKQQFDQSIACMTRLLASEKLQNPHQNLKDQQSQTGNSYIQTKLSQSRTKELEDLNFGIHINSLPSSEDPLERIKEQFHMYYEKYKSSLQQIGSFYSQNTSEQEMDLRFKIQSRQLQRIHSIEQQRLRSLNRKRNPTSQRQILGMDHPNSFNLMEILSYEGIGFQNSDYHSIYSKDESQKCPPFKNDDFLSMLNCSSIHHQFREDANMDLSDFPASNFLSVPDNLYEGFTVEGRESETVFRSVEVIQTNMISIVSSETTSQKEEVRQSRVSVELHPLEPERPALEDLPGTNKTTN